MTDHGIATLDLPMTHPESADDTLMTIREAAAYLRCSRATIFRFLQRGNLPGFKVGKKTVVYARDVKKLVHVRTASGQGNRPADRT